MRFDLLTRFAVLSIYLGFASLALAAPGDPNPDNPTSPLGTNMGYHASWSSDWVFVDQFAKSRAWISGGCSGAWDTGQTLTLDANGWVTNAPTGVCPHTLIMDGSNYPAGSYVLLWDGEGTLTAKNGVSGYTVTSPGRATFQLSGSTLRRGVTIEIRTFNRQNPVKNIRVLMPGGVCGTSATELDHFRGCASARGGSGSCGTGETCFDFESVYWNRFADPVSTMASHSEVVFHPQFLDKLSNYRNIRYMQWMRMNDGNTLSSWSSRTLVTHQDQTSGRGLAYEYASALSNALDADPWITVPHLATDAFVGSMAALFHANLSTKAKLYVEYTNEAWNGAPAFTQAAYMKTQEGCVYNTSSRTWTNCRDNGARYYAQRTRQIMDIFTSEYGADVGRLVRVMGSFAANPSLTSRLMTFLGANTGTSRRIDAVAIAPYFGGRTGSLTNIVANDPRLSMSSIFAGVAESLVTASGWIRNHATHARTYGVDLISYEGGQHLAPSVANQSNQQLIDAITAANRDPRMGQYYTQHLNDWRSLGAKTFMHYVHISSCGRQGCFGELESQNMEASSKYEALQGFIYDNDCWWTGCARTP